MTENKNPLEKRLSNKSLVSLAAIPATPQKVETKDTAAVLSPIGLKKQNDDMAERKVRKSYLAGRDQNNGLKNIGNTCFMNSALQCLCSIQPVRDFFSGPFKINPKKEGNLAKQFSALLKDLTNYNGSAVNPSEFKRTLNQYTTLFRGYEQQDSQEFLRYVLDGLSEDVNRVVEKPKYEELNDIANESVIDKSLRWYRNFIERNNSFITDLFLGQLKSEVKCRVCGRQSVTFDPFLDISLPIDSKRSKSWSRMDDATDVSLEECLKHFTEDELLRGIEQVYCSKCKQHQDTNKILSFFRLPEVLVIQLKRFSNSEKLLTSVSFPTVLNMAGYVAKEAREKFYENESNNNNNNMEYQLISVIKHFGSLRGGHYTCQVRNACGDWIEYNDSLVKKVNYFSHSDSSAYVLFYGRVKNS